MIYTCPKCGRIGDKAEFSESCAGELFCPKCECAFQADEDDPDDESEDEVTPDLQTRLDALAACPDADAVAELMRVGGYVGIPSDPCGCPIANYLDGSGSGVMVAVSPDDEPDCGHVKICGPGMEPCRVPLTPAASNFAIRFDTGWYPNLIAPTVAEVTP